MLKVKFFYDLPVFDPDKHDPDETFAFLTYRGVHYAKRVQLKSRSIFVGRSSSLKGGCDPSFFVL